MPASLHLWSFAGYRSQIWLYRQLRSLARYPAYLVLRKEWTREWKCEEFPWPTERMVFFPNFPRSVRVLGKVIPLIRSGHTDVLGTADVRFVRRMCRSLDAAVVHVHFGWLAVRLLGARPNFGIPSVVSFYGSDVFRASGAYLRRLRVLLRNRSLHFVATSAALKKALLDLGAAAEKVTVIPVGIDVSELPPMEAVRAKCLSQTPSSLIRLITVGRMIECKAFHALPEVARILTERGLNFEWTVIGNGPLFSKFIRACEQSGLADRFRIKGSLPFTEVQRLLWESDVMVLNAVVAPNGERESLGVSLIEAGAMGLPVVSCSVGGIPEVIVNGQTGFLVPAGELQTMADRILDLARDHALRCKFGLAAAEFVRSNFNAVTLATRLESLYDQLQAPPV